MPLLADSYPEKPLKIVVYTAPGGLIDITARKLANILQEEKIVPVPVVVENKKGAGGVIALNQVLNKPADGYTLFGLTSSVISKVTKVKQDKKLDDLYFLARVVTDYECIITRKGSNLDSLQAVREHALSEKQLWAGPAAGGTDHLFAMKTWKALAIKGTWIPYRSGGEAIAALMGGHAHVYVGNPQDVAGRSDLQIVAIASPERLEQFPDVPTFKELSYDSLTGEMLWRGFTVRENVSAEKKAFLEAALKQATETTAWKTFIDKGNAFAAFDTGDVFRSYAMNQVKKDKELFAQ